MGWEVGDLALCYETVGSPGAGHPAPGQGRIERGGIYVIESVVVGWPPSTGIVLAGHHSAHSTGAYLAISFVKITPGADIEGVEERRRLPMRVKA